MLILGWRLCISSPTLYVLEIMSLTMWSREWPHAKQLAKQNKLLITRPGCLLSVKDSTNKKRLNFLIKKICISVLRTVHWEGLEDKFGKQQRHIMKIWVSKDTSMEYWEECFYPDLKLRNGKMKPEHLFHARKEGTQICNRKEYQRLKLVRFPF